MGEACRIAGTDMADERGRLQRLRDRLWTALDGLGDVSLNGHPVRRWPGILNVSFAGIAAEALLAAMPQIAVSTGSACASTGDEPSHVLKAMGCDPLRARGAIRFSFGRFTTVEEIDWTIAAVGAAVIRLRELSPSWENRRTVSNSVDWTAPKHRLGDTDSSPAHLPILAR
jgi:cysteine desulfurase